MVNQTGSYDLLIQKLDRFIRKFYLNQLIRGLLYTSSLVLGLFLLFSLLENYFYFDTAVRKLIFYGFISASGFSMVLFVVVPLLKYFKLGQRIDHEQAAVIIGDHFSDVKDQLLNILQLKKQLHGSTSSDLIHASISQKTDKIKLVPFKSAIDLGKNRKYLKYALPPALILLGIFLASPTIITESTHRIINNDTEFEREAAFAYELSDEELSVVQFDDYELIVSTQGRIIPNEVFIEVDNFQYRMKKLDNNLFSYTFKNVQKEVVFSLYSGDVRSRSYELSVLLKPKLTDFAVELDYPSYIGRKDEVLSNIGDIVVPLGTKINWSFQTLNTDRIDLSFSSDKSIKVSADKRSPHSYNYTRKAMTDDLYKVFYSNELIPEPDSVNYTLKVVADEYPEISVESFVDSVDQSLVYFIGNASDDYGLTNINFVYNRTMPDGEYEEVEEAVLSPRKRDTEYSWSFDINQLELRPGEKLSYYFEVFDNDAINGSKSSRTTLMEFQKPTLEEFEAMENANEEEIQDKLEKSLKESRKIKEDLKKLREKMLQKQNPDWEDKKQLENLMERQNKLSDELKEAKEKFDENLKNQEEFTERDESVKEKQEKLQELFEEAMDPETQELMEKIQELMQELDKESMIEEMQNMEMNEESMEKNTERLLELFKTLEVEKEIKDAIEKLEELAEKQDSLSQESAQNEESDPNEQDSKEENSLQEEQEELNKEFEELQDKMKEIQEKNEDLERPKDLGEDPQEKMDDIKQDMKESAESLEKQQNKKASQKQKKASEKMKEMAESMDSAMAAMQMDQMEEDIAALRQLLENLVTLSFDQEDLVDQIKRTQINTPSYVGQIQEQFKLKDDFELIQDSLQELAKRVDKIQSFVLDKVVEIESDMTQSIEQLEEREKPEAEAFQRKTMKNVNDLALMLSESMEEMQKQMSSMMMGSQMCDNPGGMGAKPGDVPMDKITEGQQNLNEQMKQMMEKQGKDGKSGKDGLSAKEFAEAAARQGALRKALEGLQQEKMEQGKGDKGLQELIEQMDKVETDLVNKRLDNQMLLRQQEILTRLLEAKEADRQREYDNKRKSEEGKEYKKELPPALKEYLKKKQAEADMYNKVSPALRPYYKRLVEEYYKALKNS